MMGAPCAIVRLVELVAVPPRPSFAVTVTVAVPAALPARKVAVAPVPETVPLVAE